MNVITIESDAFKTITDSISEIKEIINAHSSNNQLTDKWLDIQETCNLLKISNRTLQNYRDTGILGFSQIGSKIYFKASDIEEHLKKHYNKPFNPKK